MTPQHSAAMTSDESKAHCDALAKGTAPLKQATPERYAALLEIAKELASRCLRGDRACSACAAIGYMGAVEHNQGCAIVRLREFER